MATATAQGKQAEPNLLEEIRNLLIKVVYGQEQDFWTRYDLAADAHDKAFIGRLSDNLDVLLIFAGLFSAVNTAFIVLTIADLSAPPAYQTNALLTLILMGANSSTLTTNDLNPPFVPSRDAIRQNSEFFASLCSSVLAAAGAMLGKQWLRTYERTGQIGSHEKQAELRTRKWLRLEAWGLRAVVEALPTILLLSVGLFFLALADYLWAKKSPVAIVVIAFMTVGTALYGFMVVAAAIDVYCPFQTVVSTLVRETGWRVWKFAVKLPLWTWTQTRASRTQKDTSDTSPPDPTVRSKVPEWWLSVWASARQGLKSMAMRQANVLPTSMPEGTLSSTMQGSQGEAMSGTGRGQEEGMGEGVQAEFAPEAMEGTHDVKGGASSIWARVVQKFSKAKVAEPETPQAIEIVADPAHGMPALWLWMVQKFTADQELYAHSIHWMLENATEKEDLLVTADNIPSLTHPEAMRLVVLGNSFPRLLELFKDALILVIASETQDAKPALRYGKAVAHAVLAAPEQCRDRVRRVLIDTHVESMWPAYYQALGIQPELHALCVALFALTREDEITTAGNATSQPFHLAAGAAFENMQLGRVQLSMVLTFTRLFKFSMFGAPEELLDKGIPHSDALLSLVCMEIVDLLKETRRPMDQQVRDLWSAFDGRSIMELMTAALDEHDRHISRKDIRKGVLILHTRLLLAFRSLHSVSVPSDHHGRQTFIQAVTSHLSRVLPLTDSVRAIENKSTDAKTKVSSKRKAATKIPDELDQAPVRRWDSLQLPGWSERLAEDQPVHIDSLRLELRAYVTQLQSLIGDGHEWWLSAAESNHFLDIVNGHKTEANAAALDGMLHSSTFPFADLAKVDSIIPLSSLTPIIIHALKSDLPPVFEAAYLLLGKIGTDAWELNVGPRAGQPLVIAADLGCEVIRSLITSATREDFSHGHLFFSDIDIEGLLYWLAESVREDPALGPEFSKSGITSLFISCIRDKTYYSTSGVEDRYMGMVSFLFLRVWGASTMQVEAFALEDGGLEAFATEETFRDVCEYFKQYARWWMPMLSESPINRDMYRRAFSFIEQVYQLRPEDAIALELVDVCEALKSAVEYWEEARSISLYWGAALRSARNAMAEYLDDGAKESRRREFEWCIQDIEGTAETRWWKLGGMSRLYQQPTM
ncbi:hypothetical protein FRB95_007413 [Tulasnella sp. JGI-2019a]|nr:hypothetical protein FRB95_007413 [Tulasnella sp. JGI-2019a]